MPDGSFQDPRSPAAIDRNPDAEVAKAGNVARRP
jgi:hypothetical protein